MQMPMAGQGEAGRVLPRPRISRALWIASAGSARAGPFTNSPGRCPALRGQGQDAPGEEVRRENGKVLRRATLLLVKGDAMAAESGAEAAAVQTLRVGGAAGGFWGGGLAVEKRRGARPAGGRSRPGFQ